MAHDLHPRILMAQTPNDHIWFFDLDGCLVDSMAATDLRPHAEELLVALVARGIEVRIWSAGGGEYAERVATRLGIDGPVTSFHDKERGSEGRWILPAVPDGANVTCVDDQPEGVPGEVTTIAVFPYLSRRRRDRALAELLALLDP